MFDGVKKPLWFGLVKRLRLARRTQKLSPRELSIRASLPQTSVAEIERQGSTAPTIDMVERLAAALGVPLLWLAYGPQGHLQFGSGTRLDRTPVIPVPQGPQPFRALFASCAARLRWLYELDPTALQVPSDSHPPIPQSSLIDITEERRLPGVDEAEYLSRYFGAAPAFVPFGFGTSGNGYGQPEPQDYGDPGWGRPQIHAGRR